MFLMGEMYLLRSPVKGKPPIPVSDFDEFVSPGINHVRELQHLELCLHQGTVFPGACEKKTAKSADFVNLRKLNSGSGVSCLSFSGFGGFKVNWKPFFLFAASGVFQPNC